MIDRGLCLLWSLFIELRYYCFYVSYIEFICGKIKLTYRNGFINRCVE